MSVLDRLWKAALSASSSQAAGKLLPTPRQLEVLEAMSHGLTYAAAAAKLGIGEETAKEHLKRVRERLDARNTNHAIGEAFRRGLLS